MAVSTSYSVLSYAGNGSTTAFSVTWQFFEGADLVATLVDSTGVETVQTITTHYTVSGGTDSDGLPAVGTLTMVTAPASGETLRISRNTPKTQSSTWTSSGPFSAKTLEAALDRHTLITQELVGGILDGISGDTMTLVTSGATDYWGGESHPIRNLATGTDSTDAVNLAQMNAAIAALGAFPSSGTVRAATGNTTIGSYEHVIAVNAADVVYTVDSGATWFVVSPSADSTGTITVISADSPTVSIDGDTTGVVVNANIGPVIFHIDPNDSSNYVVAAPFSSVSSQANQRWRGEDMLANLNALSDLQAGDGAYASDGRKNGESASNGTGVLVFYDGSAWTAVDTGATAAA